MALSPWPTTPAALATATATLKSAIAGPRAEDADIARVGAAASAMVEDYAPGAPQTLRDEATIRFAGYLYGSDFGGIRTEDIGPKRVEYIVNHAPAFRNSGAAGLVTRWRVRRAGAV